MASSRLKWETSDEGLEKLGFREMSTDFGKICRSDRKIFSFTSSISLLLLILRSDDVGREDLRLDLGDGKEKQEDKVKRCNNRKNVLNVLR
ncbi:uncharacterized protein DS421_17g570850 [Arachis hypogaea]|nr:uncharacterized protein DS421_17g570850 [Arachis hypogaea]